jgi:hypothetical protein
VSLAIQDLTKPVARSDDLGELRSFLDVLLEQPVLGLRITYPDELELHLGAPRTYRTSRFGDRTRGSFILGTVASSWRFETPEPPHLVSRSLTGADDAGLSLEQKAEIERLGSGLRGLRVASIELRPTDLGPAGMLGIAVSFRFSDRASLTVIPTPDPEDFESGLPDWELITPYGHHLAVGPGLCWSHLPDRAGASPPRTDDTA